MEEELVASMFEGCGFEVINLGVDVSSDKFIKTVAESHADGFHPAFII